MRLVSCFVLGGVWPPVSFSNSSDGFPCCVSSCPRACLNIPSQLVLAGIAAGLEMDFEDLHFADVAFYLGSEFSIENEFDVGYVELSSVRGESDLLFNLSTSIVLYILPCFRFA